MKNAILALLICSALGACATPGGERASSLLDFDELGMHITVTREAAEEEAIVARH